VVFLLGGIAAAQLPNFVGGEDRAEFFFEEGRDLANQDSEINFGEIIQDNESQATSLTRRLADLFGVGAFLDEDAAGFAYLRALINLALSFASFIALGFLIYGFYFMFFSDDEKGFERAKKILKSTTIAIAVIALSRFLTSFIFWLVSGRVGI